VGGRGAYHAPMTHIADFGAASQGDVAFPLAAAGVGLAALAAYVVCFVFAAQTGKLRVADYVVGSLGLFCGFGFFYFLYRANAVTLQRSFDMIEQGGDPAASRALNGRFKIAAGLAVGLGVLAYFIR
jgi:hypothetical protein